MAAPDRTAVLVAGGAGYIGSHVSRRLADAGYLPVIYDNLSTGHRHFAKWGPLKEGDVRDTVRLRQVMADHRCRAVMNFAGLIDVSASVTMPDAYYSVNTMGTLALAQICLEQGVGAFVLSSTAAVYGAPQGGPIPEAAPLEPLTPYGASKRMAERILEDIAAADGLASICLRYFNAAGADASHGIGEAHDPETHLIPLVLDAALGLRSEIAIFGDDYATPDGTCKRDYVHVRDLADAHTLALEHLLAGRPGGAINIGSGRGHSVREVIETARRVTGRDIPATVRNRRPGDPPVLVADITEAVRVLGWTPRRSVLETIIADAWQWHQWMRRDEADRAARSAQQALGGQSSNES